jgi:hypothetical protein
MNDNLMPSIFSERKRIARKVHKCCECGKWIVPKNIYWLSKGCWEGKWDEYKTCESCYELRHELTDGEDGPAFGDLREWAYEIGLSL